MAIAWGRVSVFAVVALVWLAPGAGAEPIRLRMAAIAPDGASWTRELKAFGRDVEAQTGGHVQVKWYFSAIAGDELTVLDRIRRGQIDGQAGAQFCDRLAPSLRVMRVLGLIQSYGEATHVIGRMRSVLDGEFRQNGFTGFVSTMGSDILFTREPVRSLADLRRIHPWVWNLDETLAAQLKALGVKPALLPLDEAGREYDEGHIDGFIAIPTGALAYQWSARTHWFTDLRFGFLPGCMIFANRAFDALPSSDKDAVRAAVAKLAVRFEDLGRVQDQALLDNLFARQGTRPVPPDPAFREEFLAAARAARAQIRAAQVSPELLRDVETWLAGYRAEHH